MATPLFSETLPPQNLEAEQSVLGACLIDTDAVVIVRLALDADDFYSPKHGIIFKAIVYLHDKRRPVDIQTVSDALKRPVQQGSAQTWLDEIDGMDYLATLINTVPTTANVGAYAAIVLQKAKLRRLGAAGRHITNMAREADAAGDDESAAKAMADAEAELRKATLHGQQGGLRSIGGIVDRARAKLATQGQPSPLRLEFGLKELDAFAWKRKEVLSIHAPSGNGKSTLARQIVLNLAKRGQASGFFALETFADQMDECLIATEGRISLHEIRNMDRKPLGHDERKRFIEAAERIENLKDKLLFDHVPMQRWDDVRAKVLRAAMKHGDLACFVLDYADLLEKVGKDRHEQMLIDIHYHAKALADEVNALAIVLDQAPTEMLRRSDPTPTVFDFEYAKGIPKACDGCIGLVIPANCKESKLGKQPVIPAFPITGSTAIAYSDRRLENVLIASITKGRFVKPGYLLPLYHHGPSGYIGNLAMRPWAAPSDQPGYEGGVSEVIQRPKAEQRKWAMGTEPEDEF